MEQRQKTEKRNQKRDRIGKEIEKIRKSNPKQETQNNPRLKYQEIQETDFLKCRK